MIAATPDFTDYHLAACRFVFSQVGIQHDQPASRLDIEELLPPLSPAKYAALKASVRRYGPRVPVIVDQHNQIVDGRSLDRACRELGKTCPRELRHFNSDAEKLEVALTLNCNRRHWGRKRKRALIAAYLKVDTPINDRHLAEIVGVSRGIVASVRGELESTGQIDQLPKRRCRDGKERPAQYRRIIANTPKELEKALAAIGDLPPSPTDKIVDVTTATRRARSHARKAEIASKIIQPLPDDAIRLYHCRFQELEQVAGIAPASVHLICTDIPYGQDFLPELADLGAFAKKLLVDGGLFVLYSGQYWLDRVMRALDEHLNYRWVMSSSWNGDGNRVHPLDLVNKWKPILVYSKGDWRERGRWYDLLQSENKEKDWHPWQQPLGDIKTLIQYFSEPGDLVVDPCGGGFTTAVACRNLGRRFVGCDIEEQCVATGLERLASTPVSSAECDQPNNDKEFFRTPPEVTQALLDREAFEGTILDPCAGLGDMTTVIRAKYPGKVDAIDLHEYGFDCETGVDFLTTTKRYDNIIMNPPFTQTAAFVRHALHLARKNVAILCQASFGVLTGTGTILDNEQFPLKAIYVFQKPIKWLNAPDAGRKFKIVWLVFEKGCEWGRAIRQVIPLPQG